MSSCLVLNNGKTVVMASDSSLSSFENNKYERVGIEQQKIFKIKDALIFCSGLISLVEDVVEFIKNKDDINPNIISRYLLEKNLNKNDKLFNIEIMLIQTTPSTKIYQISEYNNFEPIELESTKDSLSIYCAGFHTKELSELANEAFSIDRDVVKNIRAIYEKIACEQIGGFLEIWIASTGEIKKIYKERIVEKEYESLNPAKQRHSVVGEVIVGRILAGNTLTISNSGNNFVLDQTGATLTNAKFSIQTTNTKVIIDPSSTISFRIQKNEGGTFNDKFWVDNTGNVNFSGNLTGATGTFSGTLSASVGNIGTLVIDSLGLKTPDGVNYLRGNGDLKWGGLSISGGSATFNGNIFADKLVGAVSYTQLTDIPATKITSGTMSGSRIFGGTATLGQLNFGNASVYNVGSNNLEMIVPGTISMSSTAGAAISAGSSVTISGSSMNVYAFSNFQSGFGINSNIYVDGLQGLSNSSVAVTTPFGTRYLRFRRGIFYAYSSSP